MSAPCVTTHDTPRNHGGPVRRSAVLVLLVLAVTLPWVAPAVPRALAGLLPGPAATAPVVEDPPVLPPSTVAPTSEPGTALHSLVGLRLDAAGRPVRVTVRRLSVRSTVVPIEAPGAVLVPPSDPRVLGWWRDGAVAGAARGAAVLTGHTVHTGGGALDHLDALLPGDEVRVRTTHGTVWYAVRTVRVLGTDTVARSSDRIFRTDGPGHLVLVTCSRWNGSTYLSNTVVTADPVADLPD